MIIQVTPLIYPVFLVFLTLWVSDFILTKKTVSKIGTDVELNPIIKKIISLRGKYFYIAKILELIAFGLIIYLLSQNASTFILLIFYLLILIYAFIVAQNLSVYNKVFDSTKPFAILFFVFVIFTLFFINLSYSTFFASTQFAEKTNECNDEYGKLYLECKQTQPEKSFEVNPFDINLTLPEGI